MQVQNAHDWNAHAVSTLLAHDSRFPIRPWKIERAKPHSHDRDETWTLCWNGCVLGMYTSACSKFISSCKDLMVAGGKSFFRTNFTPYVQKCLDTVHTVIQLQSLQSNINTISFFLKFQISQSVLAPQRRYRMIH